MGIWRLVIVGEMNAGLAHASSIHGPLNDLSVLTRYDIMLGRPNMNPNQADLRQIPSDSTAWLPGGILVSDPAKRNRLAMGIS